MKNLYSLYCGLAVWIALIGGVFAQDEDEVDEFQVPQGPYRPPGYPPRAYGPPSYAPGPYGPQSYPQGAYRPPSVFDSGLCVSIVTHSNS
jgi:hypothetical protein